MNPLSHCLTCGRPLTADAPDGLCPACLLQRGLDSQTSPPSAVPGTTASLGVPAPDDLAPFFPQLEIRTCLGRGGMGVVYLARQKSLERDVALKILAPGREQDPQFATRFAREAVALARLNHPHIVTVHDFGQSGPYFYLLMEYVDGINLRDLQDNRRLEPREALTIVPALCDALQYAHDRGVVHRDIKPANLLLDRRGVVKIADFGIARLLDADPTAAREQAAGTPGYMAPEQLARPQAADHRADIYSLGVVLYEMLTGELPAEQIEPPSHKVQIDVRLDEIVLRALEQQPERRYTQASVLKTAIEQITATPPSPAPNPSPPSATEAPVETPPAVPVRQVPAWIRRFLDQPLVVRRWSARVLILAGCVLTMAFLLPVRRVEQTQGEPRFFWVETWEFGAGTPWLRQIREFNPQQSYNRFQPRTLSFGSGWLAAGVWLFFWWLAAAERAAGAGDPECQFVFTPQPVVTVDGKRQLPWLRIAFCGGWLFLTSATGMGLMAAAMLVVLGDAPPLMMLMTVSVGPLLGVGLSVLIRQAALVNAENSSPKSN